MQFVCVCMCPDCNTWTQSMSSSCSCGFVINTAIVCSFVHVCGWTPHTSELKNNCVTKTGGRWVCSLWCAGAVQHPTVCQSHTAVCSKVVYVYVQESLCSSHAGSVCISCTLSPCHIHLSKTGLFEQIHLANAFLCSLPLGLCRDAEMNLNR